VCWVCLGLTNVRPLIALCQRCKGDKKCREDISLIRKMN
jgi:hypothetical protein